MQKHKGAQNIMIVSAKSLETKTELQIHPFHYKAFS